MPPSSRLPPRPRRSFARKHAALYGSPSVPVTPTDWENVNEALRLTTESFISAHCASKISSEGSGLEHGFPHSVLLSLLDTDNYDSGATAVGQDTGGGSSSNGIQRGNEGRTLEWHIGLGVAVRMEVRPRHHQHHDQTSALTWPSSSSSLVAASRQRLRKRLDEMAHDVEHRAFRHEGVWFSYGMMDLEIARLDLEGKKLLLLSNRERREGKGEEASDGKPLAQNVLSEKAPKAAGEVEASQQSDVS